MRARVRGVIPELNELIIQHEGEFSCERGDIIDFNKHKEKRSLDANRFYWEYVGQLAKVINISLTCCHNILLRRYGTIEDRYGCSLYVVVPADQDDKVLEDEFNHLKPTSEVKLGKDGILYRTYIVLKGSKNYNTEEMSRLIDGLLDECKQVGIRIELPEEMEKLYGTQINSNRQV